MPSPLISQVHQEIGLSLDHTYEFPVSSTTCFIRKDVPNIGGGGSRKRESALFRYKPCNLPSISQTKLDELNRRFQLLGISEEDISENFIRGSGKGGQKVNKTSSCVQLTHGPAGTVIKCQLTRSQNQNRYLARCALADKLEGAQKNQNREQGRADHIRNVAERVRRSKDRKKAELKNQRRRRNDSRRNIRNNI